jgi:CCR4-NOT transcription complex subunit 3
MKKVDEGVELFDDIWEKVYSTEQQNQKEKYEMDLKKEIKKLQRLRDQIKTWIGSSDVKDKEPLLEARKLIETKMEQFKICEKETKTKTYSKEGLARAEKLDPVEEAKRNTTAWIGEYVARLTQLVEDREVEIERLMAGKGKKTNKHIIDDMNQSIINHKYHVNKLEGIARLVNNDVLDTDAVDPLKEDLDYYMDSFEDEDYKSAYDEDFFYDALGLDELDVVNVDRVTNIGVIPPKQKGESDTLSASTKDSGEKKNKKAGLSSVIPLTIGRARASSGPAVPEKSGSSGSKSGRDDSSTGSNGKEYPNSFNEPTTIPAAVSSTTKTTPSKAPRAASVGASVPAVVPPTRAAPPAVAPGGASMAAILKRETEQQEKERQKVRIQDWGWSDRYRKNRSAGQT